MLPTTKKKAKKIFFYLIRFCLVTSDQRLWQNLLLAEPEWVQSANCAWHMTYLKCDMYLILLRFSATMVSPLYCARLTLLDGALPVARNVSIFCSRPPAERIICCSSFWWDTYILAETEQLKSNVRLIKSLYWYIRYKMIKKTEIIIYRLKVTSRFKHLYLYISKLQ